MRKRPLRGLSTRGERLDYTESVKRRVRFALILVLAPGEYEITAVLGKKTLRHERFSAKAGVPVELEWDE